MANNIGYKASIDADWVTFKEQSGVEISDNGKTLETRDVIPSNLKLIVSENTSGVTREATITFTQEGGEKKTVTLRQNKSKAGTYPNGESYLNKNRSSLVINTSETTDLDVSGGTVKFTATYKKVYSINMYKTDADGNVTSGWVEDNSVSEDDVTSSSTCTWTVSPAINGSEVNKGTLFVGKNKSNGSPTYNVNATYIDSGNTFTSNTLKVNQKPAPVAWIFTVKTNNPDTIVYFLLSGDTEVKVVQHEEAKLKDDELKDDAYYSTYSLPYKSVEKPNISAYIVKKDMYTSPEITLYEKGTETPTENPWAASSIDPRTQLDAVYKATKTTYKVDNDSSNPKPLIDGEVNVINSDVDKNEIIKKRPTFFESDSTWLSIKLAGDVSGFTYSISAENNTKDSVREGHIDFKYTDDEIPSAETTFTVSQNFLDLTKFVVDPSATTENGEDKNNT